MRCDTIVLGNAALSNYFLLYHAGHDEKYFDRFVVSPDNQYLVFLGENGFMLLVSNKVWIIVFY